MGKNTNWGEIAFTTIFGGLLVWAAATESEESKRLRKKRAEAKRAEAKRRMRRRPSRDAWTEFFDALSGEETDVRDLLEEENEHKRLALFKAYLADGVCFSNVDLVHISQSFQSPIKRWEVESYMG